MASFRRSYALETVSTASIGIAKIVSFEAGDIAAMSLWARFRSNSVSLRGEPPLWHLSYKSSPQPCLITARTYCIYRAKS